MIIVAAFDDRSAQIGGNRLYDRLHAIVDETIRSRIRERSHTHTHTHCDTHLLYVLE